MKYFYTISLFIVAIMVAAPFWLISSQDTNRFDGKIVSYNVYGAKINSIDPATCGDTTSSSIQGYVYESLFNYHYLKRPYELIPQLAREMPEISTDNLTYTFRIKKGIKFARNACFGKSSDPKHKFNTRTVTAEDFVLSFKRIADYHISTKLSLALIQDKIKGINSYRKRTQLYKSGDFSRYVKENISGIKAIDEHTLQIKLTKPFPQFLYVLAMHNYAPIPHELIEYHLSTKDGGTKNRIKIPITERSTEIRDYQAMVGTGPYVMTEWIRGGKIIFERNEDFHDDFYPTEGAPGDKQAGLLEDAGKKLPFIDVRYLTFVAENNPAWMLFLTKQSDTGGIPREMFADVISPGKELLETWQKRGIKLLKFTDPAVYWITFNMEDRVIAASKSLRQAMCLSFDIETYIDTIWNGRAVHAINVIPTSIAGHEEAGPGPYWKFDPELAREKIADARRELISAGIIEQNDPLPQLVLDLGGRSESARRMGEFYQSQFQRIGLDVKIELNDWPTLQEKVHNKRAQIYVMGWSGDYPDAENFLQNFYSPNIKRGTNNANYSNPEFDRLFKKAAVAVKLEDRIPLYANMAKLVAEDCPIIMLTEPIRYALLYDWVHNFKPHGFGFGMGKYTRIDVEARKKAGGRD